MGGSRFEVWSERPPLSQNIGLNFDSFGATMSIFRHLCRAFGDIFHHLGPFMAIPVSLGGGRFEGWLDMDGFTNVPM